MVLKTFTLGVLFVIAICSPVAAQQTPVDSLTQRGINVVNSADNWHKPKPPDSGYVQPHDIPTDNPVPKVIQDIVPSRHHIIYLNIADYILQKYNIGYEYLPDNAKWRIRGYTFVDVKDQNYGLAVNAYSNWRISKHVSHIIGGSLQGEYIGSFYQDFYLKFRPRGWAIDPAFATGLVFTAADRFAFGIDAAVGPGMVFRDNRFKGVFLDVRLGVTVGVKF